MWCINQLVSALTFIKWLINFPFVLVRKGNLNIMNYWKLQFLEKARVVCCCPVKRVDMCSGVASLSSAFADVLNRWIEEFIVMCLDLWIPIVCSTDCFSHLCQTHQSKFGKKALLSLGGEVRWEVADASKPKTNTLHFIIFSHFICKLYMLMVSVSNMLCSSRQKTNKQERTSQEQCRRIQTWPAIEMEIMSCKGQDGQLWLHSSGSGLGTNGASLGN